MRRNDSYREAFWAVVSQALSIACLVPMIFIIWDIKVALSFLLGGLACVLPSVYLYRRVFTFFGATQSKLIVKAFYWGETVKIVLTALFFVVALLIPWALPVWIFLGYLVAQVGFWVAPVFISLKK